LSYNYQTEKPRLFTEAGMKIYISVRDEAHRLLSLAGAFTAERACAKASGDSWTMLAALDFMVEQGELRLLTPKDSVMGQHQVFTGPR